MYAGNIHDTQTFASLFEKIAFLKPIHLTANAGYKTPTTAQFLLNHDITPVFPYTRPRRKPENKDIVYDEYSDCYLDENNVVYPMSRPIAEVTGSIERLARKNKRVITRHVWQETLETCEDIRHSDGMRALYKSRKTSVKRLFDTVKEHHGFCYTHLIGQALMELKARLTFTYFLNTKKLVNILELRS